MAISNIQDRVQINGTLLTAGSHGKVAYAEQIWDDDRNAFQSAINQNLQTQIDAVAASAESMSGFPKFYGKFATNEESTWQTSNVEQTTALEGGKVVYATNLKKFCYVQLMGGNVPIVNAIFYPNFNIASEKLDSTIYNSDKTVNKNNLFYSAIAGDQNLYAWDDTQENLVLITEDVIGTSEIKDSAVTAAKIATDAVEEAKIKNGAVTTNKVKDNAITFAKLSNVIDATNIGEGFSLQGAIKEITKLGGLITKTDTHNGYFKDVTDRVGLNESDFDKAIDAICDPIEGLIGTTLDSANANTNAAAIYAVINGITGGDITNYELAENLHDSIIALFGSDKDLTATNGTAIKNKIDGALPKSTFDTEIAKYATISSLADYATVNYVKTEANKKQNTITGAASSVVSDNLVPDRVVIVDANGKLTQSDVLASTLYYFGGVESDVQEQIDDALQAAVEAHDYAGANYGRIQAAISEIYSVDGRVDDTVSMVYELQDVTDNTKTQLDTLLGQLKPVTSSISWSGGTSVIDGAASSATLNHTIAQVNSLKISSGHVVVDGSTNLTVSSRTVTVGGSAATPTSSTNTSTVVSVPDNPGTKLTATGLTAYYNGYSSTALSGTVTVNVNGTPTEYSATGNHVQAAPRYYGFSTSSDATVAFGEVSAVSAWKSTNVTSATENITRSTTAANQYCWFFVPYYYKITSIPIYTTSSFGTTLENVNLVEAGIAILTVGSNKIAMKAYRSNGTLSAANTAQYWKPNVTKA